jgi:hypothetical protein
MSFGACDLKESGGSASEKRKKVKESKKGFQIDKKQIF